MTTKNEAEQLETTVNPMPGQSPASTEASSDDENKEVWDDIATQLDEGENELDELGGEAPPEAPPAAAPTEETPPAPEAAPPIQQESPPETAAIPEPAPEAAPTETTIPETPAVPEISEEKFNELRENARQNIEQQYSVSEEDADLFLTDPQKAIPKMASQLYMDVYESVMRGVHMAMPGMVSSVGGIMTEAKQAEDKFYDAWPGLNEDTHRDTVVRLGAAYRTANPNADVETFIRDVGAQAMVALRLPIPGAEQVELPPETTMAPPAQATPFVPSTPSGGGQQNQPVKRNPYEELSIEFEMEDDDY